MAYRDDLAAAQAQNDELRDELAEAQRRIEELEHEKAAPPAPETSTAVVAAPAPPLVAGRVYYDPPRTYVPLLYLLRVAAVTALRCRPATGKAPDSDSLVIVLGHKLLWKPFVDLIWCPIYVGMLGLVVLPWAATVAVAGSVVLLPIVALSRLRIGDAPPIAKYEGWPQGNPTAGTAAIALWVLLSITMPPLLLVFLPLLGRSEDEGPRVMKRTRHRRG